MFWILRVVIAIVLMVWMFRQVRKPSGPLGKSLVRAMSVSHSKMTDWGLQQVSVPENAAILDIGCGGGRYGAQTHVFSAGGQTRWDGLLCGERGRRSRDECRGDRGRASGDRTGFGVRIAIRGWHV
jgi:hypothetical protein